MKVQTLIADREKLWITLKQVPELASYYSAGNLYAIFNKSGIWWIIVDRSCLLHCFSQNCISETRRSICLGGSKNFLTVLYTHFLKSTKERLKLSLIQNHLLTGLEEPEICWTAPWCCYMELLEELCIWFKSICWPKFVSHQKQINDHLKECNTRDVNGSRNSPY